MKKFVIIFICTILFFSCAEDKINPDVSLADISTAINGVISNADKLSSVDTALLEGIADLETDVFDEYIMMLQTKGTEIDQYAIFRVEDSEKIKELEKTLNDYINILQTNQEDFNYLPEETVKLKEAEVFTAGPYVVYTIMSADDKTAFKSTFNDMIR